MLTLNYSKNISRYHVHPSTSSKAKTLAYFFSHYVKPFLGNVMCITSSIDMSDNDPPNFPLEGK